MALVLGLHGLNAECFDSHEKGHGAVERLATDLDASTRLVNGLLSVLSEPEVFAFFLTWMGMKTLRTSTGGCSTQSHAMALISYWNRGSHVCTSRDVS